MTFEELVSELRGYVAEAKAEDGERWRDSEIHLHAEDLELLLDEAWPTLRPVDDWHEDLGDVLWWRLPVEEPPWVGSPLGTNWIKGYYGGWTPLPPIPAAAAPSAQPPQPEEPRSGVSRDA